MLNEKDLCSKRSFISHYIIYNIMHLLCIRKQGRITLSKAGTVLKYFSKEQCVVWSPRTFLKSRELTSQHFLYSIGLSESALKLYR